MIDQQTSEYNSIYFVLCNKMNFSIQGSLSIPQIFIRSVKSIKFSSSAKWCSSLKSQHSEIHDWIANLFWECFFFFFILPCKHVTCVFYYLVRSTCNLERVWILSLVLPAARRHSRTSIGLMKLEEVWLGEVITFSRAKLLLWFWNGFVSIRLMALDWVPSIWIPLSTWKGVTMKALVINA